MIPLFRGKLFGKNQERDGSVETVYDAIVVGGGPAGLTGAMYLARAKCTVLVLEQGAYGGQIATTEEVANYPGLEPIPGSQLGETMKAQAEGFGAKFRTARVTAYTLDEKVKTVHTDKGAFRCLGLLLATGSHPRPVGFSGEETFRGRGVSTCATCDGPLFGGREVFVVGGGYAAAEESVYLTQFARHVTILIRKGDFSCAKTLADRAKSHEKITVLPNTVLEAVEGDRFVDTLRYRNVLTGQVTRRHAPEGFGVFVYGGYAPATENLEALRRNEKGYLLTDETLQTSVPGVYAAGDVREKPLRQVVTATADGALAATALEGYVNRRRE